ncbi:two component transcriptional regulator [Novosphingobium nitrogenifigens DSM 19370]|uniref:Two component transcriptional regulator n=1 Tax=Novosphingobium nitrogenifigens DSM 19370 TaxID=983920 RepID=F1ZBE9_9SPHN|nr:response regulator transcription factor [Novosphingobium nitrogenifigens]EGD58153.1 two component transcriptional regulator [Novosphingobium nitrogenifigens DSM 19370]
MGGSVRILVIDDEPSIRSLLRAALEPAGYRVSEADLAATAMTAAHDETPQVVLLDLGLPDRDGLDLIAPLRKAGAAVVVLSARDATAQKVAALDRGADDYVTKPFDTEEVLARVRTALRHRTGPEVLAAALRFDDVEIDLAARVVRKDGVEVHLAPKEFAMLAELAANAGKVVTHAHLLRTIWGPGHESDVEYLRVAARGIRRKLEGDAGDQPSRIRNEPGVGYRLAVAIAG